MMSSTSCRPFLEENDISRQAEKPIYAEDQDNDGQTQRTGQTMVSCAAVRTEHKTASASTEHKHTSDTNSSHPSEVQTLQNLNQNTSTTCYNRFLRYYKLPILLPSQTIGSFLRYIHDNYPQSVLSWDTDTDSGQSGTGRPGHVRPEFFLSRTFGESTRNHQPIKFVVSIINYYHFLQNANQGSV